MPNISSHAICPSCRDGTNLTSSNGPTFYDNADGTSGMWQTLKCGNCDKIWKVTWNEEVAPDSTNKIFIIKCTTCDFERKTKNITDFLNYRVLHQQEAGHTGIMCCLGEEQEGKK